jgi:hypothetical protein
MVYLLERTFDDYGRPTVYTRPGYPPFSIVGIPEFLSRLEDVNRGQFVSISYRVIDFVAATFYAHVIATFSIAPNSNGTVTFDGVTYTSQMTVDDSQPGQFFRGNSPTSAAGNLAAAINGNHSAGTFSLATTAHPTCSALYAFPNPFIQVNYRLAGTIGNGIQAVDAMVGLTLDRHTFYGGEPLVADQVLLNGILYSVSDVPADDQEGCIQLRLEKTAT